MKDYSDGKVPQNRSQECREGLNIGGVEPGFEASVWASIGVLRTVMARSVGRRVPKARPARGLPKKITACHIPNQSIAFAFLVLPLGQ